MHIGQEMKKIINIVKKVILVWGVLSLCFALLLSVYVAVNIISTKKLIGKSEDIIYEAKSDEVKLVVIHKTGKDSSEVLINLSKSDKELISNYHLPVEKYGLHSVHVNDSKIIHVRDDEYRIILYSRYYECTEESTDFIWFFKFKNQLNLIHVIGLSDLYNIQSEETIIFGNKHIGLPSFEANEYKQFIIPVEIRIGDSIKILPLLSRHGITLLKNAFEKEAQGRIEKLRTGGNNEMVEEYKASMQRFSEAITEKIIAY
jgi:hypothetical protein